MTATTVGRSLSAQFGCTSSALTSVHSLSSRAFVRYSLIAALGLGACARPTAPSPARAPLQLFVFVGQSNMAGRGVIEAEDSVPNPRVLMFTRDRNWLPAIDPVQFDKPRLVGVGPARSFGLTLANVDSTMLVGLIPAAVGGTDIASWQPGALDVATQTHPYDDAIARARAAMKDGELKAIVWHQGESDANAAKAEFYEPRLRAVIAQFRADLGNPTLPFLIGQVGHFPGAEWKAPRIHVDSVHRALAAQIPNVAFVSSEGLMDRGDTTHFNAAGARELGRRYAKAYLLLVH
ncbi:MAG: sialate O-acetylesterase [bacterium]